MKTVPQHHPHKSISISISHFLKTKQTKNKMKNAPIPNPTGIIRDARYVSCPADTPIHRIMYPTRQAMNSPRNVIIYFILSFYLQSFFLLRYNKDITIIKPIINVKNSKPGAGNTCFSSSTVKIPS